MRNRFLISVLASVIFAWNLPTAQAVILFLKGKDEPIRGYLVREDAGAVTLQQLKNDGETVERTVPRTEIDQLIKSVSSERLAALDPSEPDRYREYAEELAEKRKDPDAQLAGIRLFLIAAYLEPERLGRSCLLGMAPLARDEAEQRRFRAMSYLLDPAHDLSQLKTTTVKKPTEVKLEPRYARFVIRALRLLRQNKKRDARLQARRINMKERLPLLTDLITYEEFDEACELVCSCRRGRIECPDCRGKGFTLDADSNRVTCRTCGTRGEIVCPRCNGDPNNFPLFCVVTQTHPPS